jgi:drug/metabolite transporter (DMT)-like permease
MATPYIPSHALSLRYYETATQYGSHLHTLHARFGGSAEEGERPPIFKTVGLILAIASGLFIGVSFIFSKKGLLKANEKYSEIPGEGYGYLKNVWWWGGMTLMVIGEICNFVAYAFTDAILVASLGALSVVISTVLSAWFLKERLSAVGWTGCVLCIIGSVVIALNIPSSAAVKNIQEMQDYVLKPGILVYGGLVIVGCVITAIWVAPRWGNKTVMVYLSICSLIGGLSVVATQGLGAAILAQIGGEKQFNHWFLYVLFAFVVVTLVTEVLYLNKALNIFNAALVTPTYYVYFTSATIITSSILFRGFKGTPSQIITVIMGFLTICAGVVLLQLSKAAKDVPDAAVFSGDLDQLRTIAEQEQPESDPKADAMRGTAAIIRRLSSARQKMEISELKRLHEESHLQPVGEDEQFEWDGLRRRRTTMTSSHSGRRPFSAMSSQGAGTPHPPLGMSHFPTEEEMQGYDSQNLLTPNFIGTIRQRARSMVPGTVRRTGTALGDEERRGVQSPMHPVPLTEIAVPGARSHTGLPGSGQKGWDGTAEHREDADYDEHDDHDDAGYDIGRKKSHHIHFLGQGHHHDRDRQSRNPARPGASGSGGAKRAFSFQNVFRRSRSPNLEERSEVAHQTPPRPRGASGKLDPSSRATSYSGAKGNVSAEEITGLVRTGTADSLSSVDTGSFPAYDEDDDEHESGYDDYSGDVAKTGHFYNLRHDDRARGAGPSALEYGYDDEKSLPPTPRPPAVPQHRASDADQFGQRDLLQSSPPRYSERKESLPHGRDMPPSSSFHESVAQHLSYSSPQSANPSARGAGKEKQRSGSDALTPEDRTPTGAQTPRETRDEEQELREMAMQARAKREREERRKRFSQGNIGAMGVGGMTPPRRQSQSPPGGGAVEEGSFI